MKRFSLVLTWLCLAIGGFVMFASAIAPSSNANAIQGFIGVAFFLGGVVSLSVHSTRE